MNRFFLLCAIVLSGVSHSPLFAQTDKQPNILLIVADDMGYSDAGCFGGELDTPAIDRLAAEGMQFSNFFVNPMCVVTRTSLLTGHEHSQSNEYKHSLPLARLLKNAGYRTSASGKWHQPDNPLDAGFDSFYGFLKGEINGWTGTYTDNRSLAIQEDRNRPVAVESGWYCSDAFTDHAIRKIDEALEASEPFFAYVPFNAPHGPLHAPKRNVVKYYGRFDAGWDQLRKNRIQRMQKMGLIDDRFRSNSPEAEVAVWDELPKEVQELESRRFCAYAGMVDRMDENIGRLVEHLESKNVLNDTVVIFFSDNGGNYSHGSIQNFALEKPWSPKGPRPACATGWGRLMNAPFSWYKSSAFRGGVSAPLIIRWSAKNNIKPGAVLHQRLHVSDLYPTLLDIAMAQYPATDGERKLKPLYGKSMLPVLEDPDIDDYEIREDIFWGFTDTTKGLLNGDWKIVSINDSPWKLYNLKTDPSETVDLSSKHPEKVRDLERRWYTFAENQTDMDDSWKQPLRPDNQGWGLHRVRMTMPVVSISPACSALNVPIETSLKIEFKGTIDFAGTKGKTIRLYSTKSPESPVWELDPDESHVAQGKRELEFKLPKLEPATTYYFLSDREWIRVGGKPAVGLNDGAYFYRFRTAK